MNCSMAFLENLQDVLVMDRVGKIIVVRLLQNIGHT